MPNVFEILRSRLKRIMFRNYVFVVKVSAMDLSFVFLVDKHKVCTVFSLKSIIYKGAGMVISKSQTIL